MGRNSGNLLSRERKAWQSPTEGIHGSVRRMVKGGTSQIVNRHWEFVKHCFCDEIGVEGDGLSSSPRRAAVKEMSMTATKVFTLPSMKNRFHLVNQDWFPKYVTNAPSSVHDCYIWRLLEDRLVILLGVPKHSYKCYGK